MSQFTFIFYIVTLTILRAWVSTKIILGVDEAHYYLYGKYLDWSYFDHPPMVGWVHHFFQFIPINSEFMARLPAMLCSLLTTYLGFKFLLKKGFSEKTACWGLAALNSTLLFNLMSLMMLPDTLLMPFMVAIILSAEAAEEKNDWKSWAWLGLYLGVAGLIKYTSIIFVLALVLYFLKNQRWKKLLQFRWAGGVGLSIVLILPIIFWNMRHNFQSLKYQSHHILGFEKLSVNYFLQTQVSQLILWGIGFYCIALYYLTKFLKNYFKSKNDTWELSYLIPGITFVFFLFVSFSQFLLPHWLLIVFSVFIPISVGLYLNSEVAEKTKKRVLWASFIFANVLTGIFFAEIGFHLAPGSARPGIYKQLVQWEELVAEANKYTDQLNPNTKSLAVLNWSLVSRTMYYNKTATPVYLLDQGFSQYNLWIKEPAQGRDFIIIIEDEKISVSLPHIFCDSLGPVGHFNSVLEGTIVNQVTYYRCTGFKEIK